MRASMSSSSEESSSLSSSPSPMSVGSGSGGGSAMCVAAHSTTRLVLVLIHLHVFRLDRDEIDTHPLPMPAPSRATIPLPLPRALSSVCQRSRTFAAILGRIASGIGPSTSTRTGVLPFRLECINPKPDGELIDIKEFGLLCTLDGTRDGERQRRSGRPRCLLQLRFCTPSLLDRDDLALQDLFSSAAVAMRALARSRASLAHSRQLPLLARGGVEKQKGAVVSFFVVLFAKSYGVAVELYVRNDGAPPPKGGTQISRRQRFITKPIKEEIPPRAHLSTYASSYLS